MAWLFDSLPPLVKITRSDRIQEPGNLPGAFSTASFAGIRPSGGWTGSRNARRETGASSPPLPADRRAGVEIEIDLPAHPLPPVGCPPAVFLKGRSSIHKKVCLFDSRNRVRRWSWVVPMDGWSL